MSTAPETRPRALDEDKYSIAVISNEKTAGHVPKFLTKLSLFLLKNGGKLHNTGTGTSRYSVDLKQGGLELSGDFCFTWLNKKLFFSNEKKTLEDAQKYKKQKEEVEKEKEKENKKRKIKVKKKKKDENI